MEFEGVVYRILPPTSGTSARGEWKRQDVVFELPQEFSRKICVTFFNKDHEVAQLHEGMTYIVSVNVESREFNGRWYTDVKAWRVQPKEAETPIATAVENLPPIVEEPSFATPSTMPEVDDLPF